MLMSRHPTDDKKNYYLDPVTGVLALESQHGKGSITFLNHTIMTGTKDAAKRRSERRLISFITHTPVLRLHTINVIVKRLDSLPEDTPDFLSLCDPEDESKADTFWLYYTGALPALPFPGMVSSEFITDKPSRKGNRWTSSIDMDNFMFWHDKSSIPKKGIDFIRKRTNEYLSEWLDHLFNRFIKKKTDINT